MKFEEYYEEYADTVYRFLLKLTGDEYLAEEFTQECFYKAYKNIDRYNGNCKFPVWLCQIAKNSYFDYVRKSRTVPILEDIAADDNSLDTINDRESAKELYKIIHELEEPYREVFMLKVFGELPYKDISDLFGKSENWSRVTFFRAKEKILKKHNK